MVAPLTLLSIASSFFLCMIFLPYWIKRANHFNFTSKDVHKKDVQVAEMGGLVTIFSAAIGILLYVAAHTFYYQGTPLSIHLFAALTSIFIAMCIGLVDNLLGWKIGLRQYQKALLTLMIALPIMVVNAGTTTMNVPFFGVVDFGLFYPLLIVPVAIVGASNGFNMLAGFNGLEAGLGIIQLATLGLLAWYQHASAAAVLAACLSASLVVFLYFNKYPAKVFPGDTLTYPIGASLAIIAILANIEKYAVILFVPYFFEFVLKARGLFQKESFGKLLPNGTLTNRYQKWYGVEHIAIASLKKFRVATEQRVVYLLWSLELLCAWFALLLFFLPNL